MALSRSQSGHQIRLDENQPFFKRWKSPPDNNLSRPISTPSLRQRPSSGLRPLAHHPSRPSSAAAARSAANGARPRSAAGKARPAGPPDARALHMQLAKSLAERVPEAFVTEMAADKNFAFRDIVAEALEDRRLRLAAGESLGAGPRRRKEKLSEEMPTSFAADDSLAAADGEDKKIDPGAYNDCRKIGEFLRSGAVVLLKADWLVNFSEKVKLDVTVNSASGLRNTDFNNDWDKSDPYVVCEIPSKPQSRWRSKTVKDNLNPVFNQTFTVSNYVVGDSLEFSVYDDDGGKGDERLGRVVLPGRAFVPDGHRGPLLLKETGARTSHLDVQISLPPDAMNQLPRRQELPREAIWDVEEIMDRSEIRRGYEIIAVSHAWMSPSHPDPQGTDLQKLGQFVKAWTAAKSGLLLTRVGIFIDWCSLHQEPRTRSESRLFYDALDYAGLWFAHPGVQVFLMSSNSKFHQRAWTAFEVALATVNAHRGGGVWDLGLADGHDVPIDRLNVLTMCRAPRRPPLGPKTLELQLQSRECTVKSDYELILASYAEAFPAITSSEHFSILDFSSLMWGDNELEALSETLPFFSCLQELNFHDNVITDFGADVLEDNVDLCPLLHRLCLTSNELEEGLAGLDKLRKKWLSAGKAPVGLVVDAAPAPEPPLSENS